MPEAADITDKEKRIVETTLKERYQHEIPPQIADRELRPVHRRGNSPSAPFV
jgi:hypothetical protein